MKRLTILAVCILFTVGRDDSPEARVTSGAQSHDISWDRRAAIDHYFLETQTRVRVPEGWTRAIVLSKSYFTGRKVTVLLYTNGGIILVKSSGGLLVENATGFDVLTPVGADILFAPDKDGVLLPDEIRLLATTNIPLGEKTASP